MKNYWLFKKNERNLVRKLFLLNKFDNTITVILNISLLTENWGYLFLNYISPSEVCYLINIQPYKYKEQESWPILHVLFVNNVFHNHLTFETRMQLVFLRQLVKDKKERNLKHIGLHRSLILVRNLDCNELKLGLKSIML